MAKSTGRAIYTEGKIRSKAEYRATRRLRQEYADRYRELYEEELDLIPFPTDTDGSEKREPDHS